jgi:phosphopantothenoylcysteine decarboxylase/phosphopantothenate--cysteine ligase
MGYAIAEAAAQRGAKVLLVSGPVHLAPPPKVTTVAVNTAEEMKEAVFNHYDEADIVIKAAAVADYRPERTFGGKIKKKEEKLHLTLVQNTDILRELGKKKKHQYLVGFAAETDDLLVNARKKIKDKHLDMIVGNDVSLPGAGFNCETNIVKFIYPDGRVISLEQADKCEIAAKLCETVLEDRKRR